MCVPIEGRKTRKSSGESSNHVCVEKITKNQVDEIIVFEKYSECVYKREGDNQYEKYVGCANNLMMILHDGKTRVKVAGSKTPGYKEGFSTVGMTAPCVRATILLRIPIE